MRSFLLWNALIGNIGRRLRITGFLDFVYRLVFKTLGNTPFQKLNLFLSSGEGREKPTLLGPLERANHNHWTTRHINYSCVNTLDQANLKGDSRKMCFKNCDETCTDGDCDTTGGEN
jgi:hypothetical protein